MDGWQVILRLVHILLGTLWAGTTFSYVLFIEPQLRALGPSIERPVMSAFMKSMLPAIPIAALVTIASGIALTLKMRWGHLDDFFITGWGWAMVVAFAGTVIYLVVAFAMDDPSVKGIEKLHNDIEGREPTPEESAELERLSARGRTAARTEAVLMVVVVGAMAAARFV